MSTKMYLPLILICENKNKNFGLEDLDTYVYTRKVKANARCLCI